MADLLLMACGHGHDAVTLSFWVFFVKHCVARLAQSRDYFSGQNDRFGRLPRSADRRRQLRGRDCAPVGRNGPLTLGISAT
jgi:hypothetical protein